ncbi:hypothetical protein BLNAU_6777 [Blattamonas nauphoetae]|uniref:Uncharacterized protein n=1 Tax=Blattamonas nauphoetae TaxID=2049346 RepID=A0ABQ9WLI9_9EUKA|nr:hypothetical protein BLNAU_24892 [Blattamonas nauphoetae]KAK2958290.1 hypothetical protein BLNAU_6777 [Blattamonas nauphoetae]
MMSKILTQNFENDILIRDSHPLSSFKLPPVSATQLLAESSPPLLSTASLLPLAATASLLLRSPSSRHRVASSSARKCSGLFSFVFTMWQCCVDAGVHCIRDHLETLHLLPQSLSTPVQM